jgi:hypothetical protein
MSMRDAVRRPVSVWLFDLALRTAPGADKASAKKAVLEHFIRVSVMIDRQKEATQADDSAGA